MRKFFRRLRRILAVAGVVLLIVVVALGSAFFVTYTNAKVTADDGAGYDRPLIIPPLLEPTVGADGTKKFSLRLQAGQTELLPGTRTGTWGANGSYLGPTLRARRGDKVQVDVANTLDETTTLHWHGMHLPPAMDGGPHQMVQPGQTWSPTWTVDQAAASLWYHPHMHGQTEAHLYRGLAGMWLLDDDESDKLALPNRYGVDDIPLVLQDKRLDDEGNLQGMPFFVKNLLVGGPVGQVGDKVFVNGTYQPVFTATTTKVRLRVVNANNGRPYNLAFADDRQFQLIATDNGLLGRPVTLNRLPVSPGERVEIVADIKPGESAVLRTSPQDIGATFPGNRLAGADDTIDLLRIAAGPQLTPSPAVPAVLSARVLPDPPPGARVRKMELFGQSYINNKNMSMSRIDEVLTTGSTEIWEVKTDSMPHSMHIHGVTMRVLDVDGSAPKPWDLGPKDTVNLKPGGLTRIAVYAPKYADEAHPYMFHCHVLFHEDRGMMGQFLTVKPGREAQVSRTLGDAHAGHHMGG